MTATRLHTGASSDTRRAAPPWRTLIVLALLVLAAHVLLLRQMPARFGLAPDAAPAPAPSLAMRTLAHPPPPPTVKPPPQKPAAAPIRPRPRPVRPPQPFPPATAEAPSEKAQTPLADDSLAATGAASSTPDSTMSTAAATTSSDADDSAEPPLAAASAPALPQPTPVTAMALPGSVRLKYKMTGQAKGLTYHANAQLDWRNGGDSYDARMVVSALFLGSRSMSSSGQLGPAGMAPQRFTDKSRNELAAHFEPDKGLVIFSANTPSAPWVAGAQDRATVFLQLGGMIAAEPANYPLGTEVSMYTIGPRNADMWTFKVTGDELLQLPYGELATVKVIRQPRREFDQKVEVWYAPSLGYLPVRNRITQANGDFIEQLLTALEQP